MRKIGINLHAATGLSDEDYIKAMAGVGFEACFSGVFERERQLNVARLLEKHGISYDTLHAPFDGINAMWSENEDGDAMLARLKNTVDNCAAVGVPIAVVHLSSGEKAPSITDAGRKRYGDLVEYAVKKNIKIAFENQRKLANLAWAMETFGTDEAGFCWDCGHESCFTPGREYMPLFGDRIVCTHIHDNHGIYNGDDHILPFCGSIDFEKVAMRIKESGFCGTLMLEVFSGDDPQKFLEIAAQAAKKLCAMTDK
ncbi:MAG: sugar phosphate isomerase/epimerase [Clostridia bacterium]|nr:sugar phosphate isomerase/epimerase [Clostridia bacterium]